MSLLKSWTAVTERQLWHRLKGSPYLTNARMQMTSGIYAGLHEPESLAEPFFGLLLDNQGFLVCHNAWPSF